MKVIQFGVFLDANSESPLWLKVKMLPWKVMGKKLFCLWSRDRLDKHEFDCLTLSLGLGLWLGLWIFSGLWLTLGFM